MLFSMTESAELWRLKKASMTNAKMPQRSDLNASLRGDFLIGRCQLNFYTPRPGRGDFKKKFKLNSDQATFCHH